jgi:hypothetical protein
MQLLRSFSHDRKSFLHVGASSAARFQKIYDYSIGISVIGEQPMPEILSLRIRMT